MAWAKRPKTKADNQRRHLRRSEMRIAKLGLAEFRRRENIDKCIQRYRRRFREGHAIRFITLDGLRHEAGCECYDCLYGAGRVMWDEALRMENLTAFEVQDNLPERMDLLGRLYGGGR